MKKNFIKPRLTIEQIQQCRMAMHGFLLDWKSVKKTRRPNYISPLKNKLIH